MLKKDHVLVVIHVTDRLQHAVEMQRVLTAHGNAIKTRLGLNEFQGKKNLPGGLILLEVVGDGRAQKSLTRQLSAIEGIEVQTMVFQH